MQTAAWSGELIVEALLIVKALNRSAYVENYSESFRELLPGKRRSRGQVRAGPAMSISPYLVAQRVNFHQSVAGGVVFAAQNCGGVGWRALNDDRRFLVIGGALPLA
jgi:hypothetical protein